MKQNEITVIVPAYNVQFKIVRCLNSLLNQIKCSAKIIVINDGSTDKTLEILKEFTSKYKQIKVISQRNKGVSFARNKGLQICDTKYVTFVDADDYVDNEYLYNLYSGFLKKPKIDLSVSGVKCVDFNGRKINLTALPNKIINSSQMLEDIFKPTGPAGYLYNKLWKMDIINAHHICFDTDITMAEDLLFTVRYLQYTDYISYTSAVDYNYVRSKSGLSSGIEITQHNARFREINENYLEALKKIIFLIPNNLIAAKKAAYVKYAISNINFARQLRTKSLKLTTEDSELAYILTQNGRKYKGIVLESKVISNKAKMIFVISLCCPSIMALIDKVHIYFINR